MPETEPGARLPRSRVGERRAGLFQAMVQACQGRHREEPAPEECEPSALAVVYVALYISTPELLVCAVL